MLTFTDPIEAAQWGEEFFASVSHVLTQEEMNALCAYKYGAYRAINETLRESDGVIPFPLPEHWMEIFEIDSALSKSLLPPVTLYRGHQLSPKGIVRFDADTLVGKTIWNRGFCSTSLLLQEACEYYLQYPQESAILTTETPVGMEGIYLDVKEIINLRQYEILLPRNIGWKVLHTERDVENRRIIISELVWES